MANVTIGVISLCLFLILMFIGFNIPFAMMFGGAIGIIWIKGAATAGTMISSEFINTFCNYSLSVGPMFGLMGYVASFSGIGEKLFDCMKTFLGHRNGGLASAVQVASAGFGAICGSPVSCNATMTAVAYPEMRKNGYEPELAALCICGGGTLSVLIPPSSNFIIYGIATETPISQLFMAGILPGIALTLINIVTIKFILKRHPKWGSVGQKYNWKQRWESVKHGGIIEVVIVFVIAMGGMFAGFFTPTEAGAVGVAGMTLVAAISRQLTWKKFLKAVYSGVRLQATIYLLLACANVLAKMFSVSTIPMKLGNWVAGLGIPNFVIMMIILAIYFILGMFTDLQAMILVTIPMFYPIIVDYCGYSTLWFGVVLTLMMSIGSMTPPVGTSIFFEKGFIMRYDPDVTVGRLFSCCWPWVANRIIATAIFIVVPQIITWLPHLVYNVQL